MTVLLSQSSGSLRCMHPLCNWFAQYAPVLYLLSSNHPRPHIFHKASSLNELACVHEDPPPKSPAQDMEGTVQSIRPCRWCLCISPQKGIWWMVKAWKLAHLPEYKSSVCNTFSNSMSPPVYKCVKQKAVSALEVSTIPCTLQSLLSAQSLKPWRS